MPELTSKQKNYRLLMIVLFWTFLIAGLSFYIMPTIRNVQESKVINNL